MKKLELNGEIPVNCYFITNSDKETFIVDPGYDKKLIINYVNKHNFKIIGILLTHAHFDHIGALNCFDVPIYIHEKEIDILNNRYKNGFAMYNRDLEFNLDDLNIIKIKDKEIIKFKNDEEIKVFHTPGHTKGGVCYLYNNDLYTGDTLFKGAVGRWDFPTGRQNVLKETIINLLEKMDENINVYPAHGNKSTIKEEKINNQYYAIWKENKTIPSSNSYYDDLFNKAKDLLEKGDLVKSLIIFKKIVKNEPSNIMSRFYIEYCNYFIENE